MTEAEQLRAYAEALTSFRHDPLGFVLWAYPWGVRGTFLEEETGPDVWQRLQLVRIGEHLRHVTKDGTFAPYREAISSGHGIGKASPINDLALTPSGIRRWGDLVEGDLLFGADGVPTRIKATHHFPDCPMMRVRFDDGSSVDVSTGHLWNVRGRQERRKGIDGWRTLETCEIARLGVKRPNGAAMARQWEIPVQGAAQFNARDVPLHPYLVGVWIGDGCRNEPSWGKPCREIGDRVRSHGYDVSVSSDGLNHRVLGVRKVFHTLPISGLGSHERFIPDDYKFNTVEARRALLDGLLDTDGEVHKSGSIGYSTTSERLAHDVIWLARSLGCKAMMQPTVKHPSYTGVDGQRVKGRDCWRVTINAPFNPFTHPAKRETYKPSEARYLTRWIDSIEPVDPQDGMCVTVEASDGLYQARDFIVTHNSAQTAFIVHWALTTCPNTKGVVTANSDTQLRTKTWSEVAKWFDLHCQQFPIARKVFEVTATSLRAKGKEAIWAINAIPNNPQNPAAFAGMHNAGSRILMLPDEASEIAEVIWDTIEGALTDADTEIVALAYGNPTKVTGRFKDMVVGKRALKNGGSWLSQQIDSRDAKRTNKAELSKWVAAYGLDSDFIRVRVLGLFPKSGATNLIPTDRISLARKRDVVAEHYAPVVAGLDCARYGDDRSVLAFRQGRDARSRKSKTWQGLNTQVLAAEATRLCRENFVHTLFVDVGGLGAGVYDRIVVLANGAFNVVPINFGSGGGMVFMNGIEARSKNKRASMYIELREWLDLGCIEDDNELDNELSAIEYTYAGADGAEMMLEPKKMMKARLGYSPDKSDALALTFGLPVLEEEAPPAPRNRREQIAQSRGMDHEIVASGSDGFDALMAAAYKELD